MAIKQLRLLEQTELAYQAGIIDGEGHIGIHKQKGRTSNHGHGYWYVLLLVVQMADVTVPMWLYNTFGGSLQTKIDKQEVRRIAYHWSVSANKAAYILSLVLPYLRVKKIQAEIAIEFQQTKVSHKREIHRYCPKSDILLEAEAILAEEVKRINAGGIK